MSENKQQECAQAPIAVLCAGSQLLLPQPPARQRSQQLQQRLADLQERLDSKRYAAMVSDVTQDENAAAATREDPFFPTTKLQLSFGLHVIVTMGTFYALAYYGGLFLLRDHTWVSHLQSHGVSRTGCTGQCTYSLARQLLVSSDVGISITYLAGHLAGDMDAEQHPPGSPTTRLCSACCLSLSLSLLLTTPQAVLCGCVGLVCGLLLETTLLILRTNMPVPLDKKYAHLLDKSWDKQQQPRSKGRQQQQQAKQPHRKQQQHQEPRSQAQQGASGALRQGQDSSRPSSKQELRRRHVQ